MTKQNYKQTNQTCKTLKYFYIGQKLWCIMYILQLFSHVYLIWPSCNYAKLQGLYTSISFWLSKNIQVRLFKSLWLVRMFKDNGTEKTKWLTVPRITRVFNNFNFCAFLKQPTPPISNHQPLIPHQASYSPIIITTATMWWSRNIFNFQFSTWWSLMGETVVVQKNGINH